MKTIQVLNRPEEIAALWGDGFTMVLGNGQEIVIKIEGGELLKMANGKIQALLVSAEGDAETLGAVIRNAFQQINHAPAIEAVRVPDPPAPAAAIAAPPPTTAAPRKAVRRGKQRNTPGDFPCRHCDRVLRSAQARGKHESMLHGHFKTPATATKNEKLLPCGMNGCLLTFKTEGWRKLHWEKTHGKK